MSELIYRQTHGYRSGHQLLESNIKLDSQDQELIDRLSDMAGSLRPGELFNPYLTAYPLPSLKYYALAKTVQDLGAPRAGCVITTTFIVTMETWINGANVKNLIEELDFSQSDEATEIKHLFNIQSPFASELVEAIFLEQRKPIVVFDANNEIPISIKLLTSFWPSKRKTFSVCTYALSPRTLRGKSFDLLFSPKSARVRFSDWEGRRIESNEKQYVNRHRWTKTLTDLIFNSESPDLLAIDNLGALAADVNGDEAVLRLTLMWHELLEKAEYSPLAALGLIDIANSQKKLELVSEELRPKIIRALQIISSGTVDPENSWLQIAALLNKLDDTSLKKKIIPYVVHTGDVLTKSDWRSALKFLKNQNFEELDHTLLIKKILDRLAILAIEELVGALGEFSSFQLLEILFISAEMRSRILSSENSFESEIIYGRLIDAVDHIDQSLRTKTLKYVLPFIRHETSTGFLSKLLKDISIDDLLHAATILWKVNGIRFEKIGNELCQAAIDIGAAKELRENLLSADNDTETLKCIEKLLTFSKEDLKWILTNERLGSHKAIILASLINQASASELIRLDSIDVEINEIISLLAIDIEQFRSALIKILSIAKNLSLESIKIYISVFKLISVEQDKSAVGSMLLSEALRVYDKNLDGLVESVVDLIARSSVFKPVMYRVFDNRESCADFSQFLEYLNGHAKKYNLDFNDQTYAIISLITNNENFELLEPGSKALAELIARLKDRESNKFEALCFEILDYSLSNSHLPVSALVVESFPPIYKNLKKGGENNSSKFFNFFDWDRCKILRKVLVHTYVSAPWPPIDFAVCASRTGDMTKIFKLVVKTCENNNYLLLIRNEAMNLHGDEIIAIRNAIDEMDYDFK